MKRMPLFLFLVIISIKNLTGSSTNTIVLKNESNINAILSSALNQNGRLDQSFGNNNTGTPGTTYLPQIIAGRADHLFSLLIDDAGNIVCGGQSYNFFSIARFTSSGLSDTGFGNGGSNYVNFPIGGIEISDVAYAMTQDETGYILGGAVNCGFGTYGIAKFTLQGFLDKSFGGRGNGTNFITEEITGNGNSKLLAMTINPTTGNIITAGYSTNVANNYFSLAQFLPSGILDTFFGGNGTGYTYLPLNIAGGSQDSCSAVGLQSTGNIILAGSSKNAANELRFAVACYTPTGTLNTSFGNNGTAYIPYTIAGGNQDECYALAIQPDDKIILAGRSSNGQGSHFFALARFTANGQLDTTFGTNGTTYIRMNGLNNYAYSVKLQQDGKIVVAGYGSGNFTFARFNNNGSIDTTFGNNGTYSFIATNVISTAAIQLTDNTIIAGGNGDMDQYFCLCKLSNVPKTEQFQSIYAGQAGLAA